MENAEIKKLRLLTSFEALVDYLRDELDWPVEVDDVAELDEYTFSYEPSELGIDPLNAVKIESIRQLRPLEDEPWGIFYIEFESKRLPVVVLRRILQALVPTSRIRDPNRKAWQMNNLLFISSQGEPDERSISFAHFHKTNDGKNELRTFSWDSRESHLYYIKNLNLEALRWPARGVDAAGWRNQWSQAFTVPHRYVPKTAQALAGEMAQLAADIRDTVVEVYDVENTGGPLHQLHLSFRMTLINDLSEDDFADMYAQTIAYGLFSARATQQEGFAIQDVAAMIPNTNPFLRELLEQLTHQEAVDLNELGVERLAEMLRNVDMEAILRDFGKQRRGEDPVIHFYETFLGAYDAKKKAQRGVFYTPDPVVSFIVRSVDHILRTEFDCPDGLADTGTMEWKGQTVPKVQILDPATGTGTFLQYVIQVIWDTFYQKNKKISAAERKAKWNRYVSEHLLPRLHGFELMMAPYTIAHMKLGLKLKETGYEFGSDERLRVYLTNALQPAHEVPRTETPALAHEVERANDVKMEIPVSVLVGNPPYSYDSTNVGEWISLLMRDYYRVDNKPLNEKNPKGLQDDYVKFFRFAQAQVTRSKGGLVAFITNHGYLDNPTFRGMRQELLKSFSNIYILDLHGNLKKKEKSPDGSLDENVFDIQPGVAICFLIKKPEIHKNGCRVFHANLFGNREHKYDTLLTTNISSTKWVELSPTSPSYYFVPLQTDLMDEYYKFFSVPEFMTTNSVGLYTARDNLAIQFTKQEAKSILSDFSSLKSDEARKKYDLGSDSRDWKVSLAQKDLLTPKFDSSKLQPISYRPFDVRYTYFTGNSRGIICMPRPEVMSHMTKNQNIGIAFMRRSRDQLTNNFLTQRHLVDKTILSSLDNANFAPLYLFNDVSHSVDLFSLQNTSSGEYYPNLTTDFIKSITEKLELEYSQKSLEELDTTFGPEDIFHYMYAIFYCPSYRERYAEFLKIDFPRLPMTSSVELFRALCGLGADLVALHLLEDDYEAASWVKAGKPSPLESPITTFLEGANGTAMGSFSKSKVYDNGRVYLDTSLGEACSYFDGVPEDVWKFQIGGYQVLYKWLYDRRAKSGQPGRILTAEDITHYQRVVVALKETMRLMDEVDEVIESHGGWPVK